VKGKSSSPKSKTKGGGGAKGDTKEIIRSYLYDMHKIGIDSVDEKEILLKTGYARTDSTGYRKTMTELVKDLGQVQKSSGKLSLTEEGLSYMAANGSTVKVAPVTMEEHQEQLKDNLLKNAKVPKAKLDAFWDVMVDGEDHTHEELLAATEYTRKDSTGYREILKWCKKLDLLETISGGFKFTDKVYRFGARPN